MKRKMYDIPIEKLVPNPFNLRRNLQNIDELAKGIAASGIEQNLVVMPDDIDDYNRAIQQRKGLPGYNGKFIILAGHRRHEASKIAGLQTVPCYVKEECLTKNDQLALMMQENCNRKTLTYGEEIYGVQLMLEGGETVKTIHEKTGLNKEGIRKRKIIAETLGADEVEYLCKKAQKQISLDECIKLGFISSPKLRNELVEKVGTHEFDVAHQRALEFEATEKTREYLKARVQEKAPPTETEPANYTRVDVVSNFDSQDLSVLEKIDSLVKTGADVCSKTDMFGRLHIYAKGGALHDEAKLEETEKALLAKLELENQNKTKKLYKQAYDLRISFIKMLKPTPKLTREIVFENLSLLLNPRISPYQYVLDDLELSNSVADACKTELMRDIVIVRTVCACLEPGYSHTASLDEMYSFLKKLGYVTTAEEEQL